MSIVSDVRAECPKCQSECITYGTEVFDGECLYFPATCDDCGVSFKEWYGLTFIECVTNE